jgi:hypothetical protein
MKSYSPIIAIATNADRIAKGELNIAIIIVIINNVSTALNLVLGRYCVNFSNHSFII